MIVIYIEPKNESDVSDWKVGFVYVECPECHKVEPCDYLRREDMEMYTKLPNGNYQSPIECPECLMN